MLNFFSVCKFDKAKYISLVFDSIRKYYIDYSYSLIIPDNEYFLFEELISKNKIEQVNLIKESHYMRLDSFRELLNNISDKYNSKNINHKYLGWYYQQVLKISHCIETSKYGNIVMIDADTVFLKKVEFFDKKKSIVYISNYEKNFFYKKICDDIFSYRLKNWESSTIQLFSLTHEETINLIENLSNFRKKNLTESYSEWLANIFLDSVIKRFSNINGSFISEQDLIAYSNINNGSKISRNLTFLRSRVIGEFNNRQKRIASFLGFSYFSYESWIIKKRSMNKLDFLICIIINFPAMHKFLKLIQNNFKFLKDF